MTHLIAEHGRDGRLYGFGLPARGQVRDGVLVVLLVVRHQLLALDGRIVTLHLGLERPSGPGLCPPGRRRRCVGCGVLGCRL